MASNNIPRSSASISAPSSPLCQYKSTSNSLAGSQPQVFVLTFPSVPPNVTFENDDVEKEWTWSKPFDLIFSRVMAGSFTDYKAFVDKSFK